LAAEIGVDRTTVGRWERGETDPQPYIRARLCRTLKVTPAELDTLITAAETMRSVFPPGTRHLPLVSVDYWVCSVSDPPLGANPGSTGCVQCAKIAPWLQTTKVSSLT
jgi:DNA-binding XRE family transcriptional regulator